MEIKMSRKVFIRWISFITAVIIVGFGYGFNYYQKYETARKTISYDYMRNISNLSTHLLNIDNDLLKLQFSSSPETMALLSAKIWRESGYAKGVISSLPLGTINLENTNKFLSQVGDYCQSIAQTAITDQTVLAEYYENIAALNEYSTTMLTDVLVLNDAVQTGSVNVFQPTATTLNPLFDFAPSFGDISTGFAEFEDGFTAYPTLIYDGPFSDHIMQRQPLLLEKQPALTQDEAKQKVASITGTSLNNVTITNDEDSIMPSYGFSVGSNEFSITKKGGFLSYMVSSRSVSTSNLTTRQAQAKADEFIEHLIQITNPDTNIQLVPSYYEITNNVITFNYVTLQSGVMVYTELVKIGIALDTGDIHSFDSRGYIVNHYNRTPDELTAIIPLDVATKSVSPTLKVEKSQLAIIPSSGLSELLCYEFLCSYNDQKVLVYVNALTNKEEQILILLEDGNGQLTM